MSYLAMEEPLAEVRRLAFDDKAEIETRKNALRTLIESRPTDLRSICEKLLRVKFLNAIAVRGLALFDDPAIGKSLAASYRAFHPSEKPAVIDTLASRPAFARALWMRSPQARFPVRNLTAFHARVRSAAWPIRTGQPARRGLGELRDSPADRREAEASSRASSALTKEQARRSRTWAYAIRAGLRLATSCTETAARSDRTSPAPAATTLTIWSKNLIDPSALVSAEYRMSVVAMSDGRVLNGMVRNRTDRTITLQTQTETKVLDRTEVEAVRPRSRH